MLNRSVSVDLLVEIAQKAGSEILKIYNDLNYQVEIKDDSSPLTCADRVANDLIIKELTRAYRSINIVSEETELAEYAIRKQWKEYFLIDPLDGTKEFINRNGEFTVNIAFISNRVPVIGVVYAPVDDVLYFSDGTNSYKVHNGKKIELPVLKKNKDIVTVVASRSHLNEETKNYIEQIKNVEFISMGSSLKLCLIAEGDADVYPRFAPTSEWDTAAAHAVVRTAGAKLIDVSSKNELLYNKQSIRNSSFVVCRDHIFIDFI